MTVMEGEGVRGGRRRREARISQFFNYFLSEAIKKEEKKILSLTNHFIVAFADPRISRVLPR